MHSGCLSPLLLVAWFGSLASAYVEPPANVTLQCHNLKNTVRWDYGVLSQGTRFKVAIKPYEGDLQEIWVDPPAQEADLSLFSDSSTSYFLEVFAVDGQNESVSAPLDGLSYSYYQDTLAEQTCYLDFPPVNVTAEPNDHLHISFIHPWLWHHPTPQGSPNHNPKGRQRKSYDTQGIKKLPEFTYEVVVNSGKQYHFPCTRRVCEKTVPVEAAQEKPCLNIKGEVENIAVKSSQSYCALPPAAPQEQDLRYIYIVIGVLALNTVLVILFIVYRKKTRASTTLPKSFLNIKKTQNTAGTAQEQFTVATVEPASPTPLLHSCSEESEVTATVTPTSEPEFRLPIGVSREDKDLNDVAGEGQPNDEGHGYMEGGNLDEDETVNSSGASSGYEKRQVLVDMGDDELAEGYRTRNL
ncbi:growth/differentiation factor 10b [Trachinotus anak]|uniref:growth/differentiation factor 10b n=1 Tax=Trachinotus anak TaxID=443729 RepID=UPI0039F1C98C